MVEKRKGERNGCSTEIGKERFVGREEEGEEGKDYVREERNIYSKEKGKGGLVVREEEEGKQVDMLKRKRKEGLV